jgi:hypothetical protein
MRRQDGRSVSNNKLTYQRHLARRKRPRPLRSTFHATSPDAIVYVVLLQPGGSGHHQPRGRRQPFSSTARPSLSEALGARAAKRATTKDEINGAVKRAAEQQLKGILGYTEVPNVRGPHRRPRLRLVYDLSATDAIANIARCRGRSD